MAHSEGPPPGPDLGHGVPLSDIPASGLLTGHVGDEAVLLVRTGDGFRAVGAHCTHYGAPLAKGLVAGNEIRCPWHHACFDLRSGQATCAPAFAALPTWRTEVAGDTVYVRERNGDATPAAGVTAPASHTPRHPRRVVIVGGGAAGYAAARRLRALGFDGSLVMFSDDPDLPCDRPNLSKDYLAGTAPEEWIPLQDADAYAAQGIDLRLACNVVAIDRQARRVSTAAHGDFDYDALLLATGAEPRRLPLPGFDAGNVFVLRSLGDARAIIAAATGAHAVAFIGAGFIGLEAAAALRARGLAVAVVAPEAIPMQRVLGPELGSHVADLHRAHGVAMHLGRKPVRLDGKRLLLDDSTVVAADLVVVGAGVAPRTALAEAAGLAVDNGILVDARLQASVPGIFAAGDVARYPHAGGRVRVEHWVHAQRQGQCAADNILGAGRSFADVPFFWTHQFDLELRYTGLGEGWDEVRMDGAPAGDFIARYYRDGVLLAAASRGRDRANLEIERELQRAACSARDPATA